MNENMETMQGQEGEQCELMTNICQLTALPLYQYYPPTASYLSIVDYLSTEDYRSIVQYSSAMDYLSGVAERRQRQNRDSERITTEAESHMTAAERWVEDSNGRCWLLKTEEKNCELS